MTILAGSVLGPGSRCLPIEHPQQQLLAVSASPPLSLSLSLYLWLSLSLALSLFVAAAF